jgi:phospholipid transport system substrate-binding protein
MLKTWITALITALGLTVSANAQQAEAPDALIKRVSSDVLEAVKADKQVQAGDIKRVMELVDQKVLPYTNFERMTAMATGRHWRQATPEQQKRLQQEFKTLLVRTYAGALSQVKDQAIEMRPLRAGPDDTEVIVRTQVVGKGTDPIQLDYRLEKTASSWKVYDLNVLGVWLVENYRASFSNEITKNGIDGLIATLAERNKQIAQRKQS